MYWMWSFHAPGEGLLRAFRRMLPEQKCITFALFALIVLNQPQAVFYGSSLYAKPPFLQYIFVTFSQLLLRRPTR
jgi:hypothetical protein